MEGRASDMVSPRARRHSQNDREHTRFTESITMLPALSMYTQHPGGDSSKSKSSTRMVHHSVDNAFVRNVRELRDLQMRRRAAGEVAIEEAQEMKCKRDLLKAKVLKRAAKERQRYHEKLASMRDPNTENQPKPLPRESSESSKAGKEAAKLFQKRYRQMLAQMQVSSPYFLLFARLCITL